MNKQATEYQPVIKELLKYTNLDKLLKYAPRDNFPPEVLIAILEECRRRTTAGKFLLKKTHIDRILDIAGIFYEQLDKDDQFKVVTIFNDIEALYNNIEAVYKEPENVDWDEILKQCEIESEKAYWEEAKRMGLVVEDAEDD